MNSSQKLPESLDGATVLVAGGAGFIPSTLSEFYLKMGAKVIGIDNFITGSRSNLEKLFKYPKYEFHEMDIVQGLPDFSKEKIDYIFSLASPASPIDFKIIPLEIMRVNSEGTLKLLELAKEKGSRFLEASTSEVYGDPLVHPQVETYLGNVNCIGPRSSYDESKRFAESMTMVFNRFKGLDTRIIRIFNTYGPGMRPDDGRVIPNFINQALENKDITVYGDGTQTRSFCFVTDLVRAIHHVMFCGDSTPYNCGNPDEYTIKECAEEIIKVLGSKSKLAYRPLPVDDPKQRKPNISKLHSLAGFKPEVSFSEGIKSTALFFKRLKKERVNPEEMSVW